MGILLVIAVILIICVCLKYLRKQNCKMNRRLLGRTTICNGRPETAPHIGSFCFPICWRCFSMIVSATITTIAICYTGITLLWSVQTCIVLIVLLLPCVCDGVLSYFTDYESSNIKRITTGTMAGSALRILVFFLIKAQMIHRKLKKRIVFQERMGVWVDNSPKIAILSSSNAY